MQQTAVRIDLVTVLRDTNYSGVILKKGLVKKEQLTGKISYTMTIESILLKAPYANVKVSTLYSSGTVKALCIKDSLYELIIKNNFGSRAPDDQDETFLRKGRSSYPVTV